MHRDFPVDESEGGADNRSRLHLLGVWSAQAYNPKIKLGNCVATRLVGLPGLLSAYSSFGCRAILQSPGPARWLALPYISESPPTFRSSSEDARGGSEMGVFGAL
jgi:hypothetical protein